MTRLGSAMLSLMIAMPVAAAPDMAAPNTATPAEGAASESNAPDSLRLKFKSRGPVCLCGNGLSEKDIERATKPSADRSTEPHPTRSKK